ncbi:MAG: manganese efflux pump MntP family protein [Myxococcota bacterium]|jgi:putative Mn2+ efflux pump MntP|nr:manganese efflux pump MntP family protein [Myxococcota bacterium]
MGIGEILLLAVGLAMDAAAVSLGIACAGWASGRRPAFRLAFHFGLFQTLMPILGWTLGRTISDWLRAVDHWIAFGLLLLIGGKMIREGLRREPEDPTPAGDPTRGWSLVLLSLATSIDALAVGLSLAFLDVRIWLPSLAIGGVTAGLSLLGVRLGARLGQRFGQHMAIVGGLILVGIGLRILLAHLLE